MKSDSTDGLNLEQKTQDYWILSSNYNCRLTGREVVTMETALKTTAKLKSSLSPHRKLILRVIELQQEMIVLGGSPSENRRKKYWNKIREQEAP